MAKYAKLAALQVAQTEPLDERQVQNNAGGYVYQLDCWKRLDRFLVLGSDSNTYYQDAKALTKENSKVVQECYDINYPRTVARIVDISDAGRAARNDAAIWALAIGSVHNSVRARQMALGAIQKVCRTATHLFQFLDMRKALGGGWGRAMKRAVANWYASKSTDSVGYQMIKYRNREGYTHKRALELAHVPNKDRKELYAWAKGKEGAINWLPDQVKAHLAAMEVAQKELPALISEFRLPWEAIPTEAKTDPAVWQAMLPDMGLTALIRNLGVMTKYGALEPNTHSTKFVCSRLNTPEELKKGRIHPFTLLQAMKVYGGGRGFRGKASWEPIPKIVDALENAFYKAFQYLEPTGKRIFIGLDVSGSMSSPFRDSPLTVAEAAAAMAMVTMRTEENWHVMGFADGLRDLKLRSNMTLEQVLEHTVGLTFGGTDCALPMLYAQAKNMEVDVFQVITDNETWAGRIHPSVALGEYRRKTGINAKLVVMGMTSTGFSIADPDDPGMLDVVGMDSSVPTLVSDFARG